MSAERTAWHPPFTTLLRERAPRWAKVTGEVQLTQEPQRADDCIEVRVDVPRDTNDCGEVLRGLWPHVRCVALLEFKSVSRPFRRGDLARLLAYGLTWFYAHQHHEALSLPGGARRRASAGDITLVLVVPSLTPTLLDEVERLSTLTLERRDDGYHLLRGAFCAVVVVELERAAEREHDPFMGWFAGRSGASVDVDRWVWQNTSKVNEMDKASPALPGYDDWLDRLVDARLAGLAPEARLAGLAPEVRLAGVDAAHQVLALADEVLRVLPESYLATLPDDVQQKVRARLAKRPSTP